MNAGDPLVVEREGAVLTVRLDRPRVLNALDGPLLRALHAALGTAADDPGVRCIVLMGNGRSFCAGGDLSAFLAMDGAEFAAYIEVLQALARRMRALRIPTIAAVHGYVLAGGFELAAGCDIRIAADDAIFGLPDTGIGLSPTSGLSFLLPRIVGEGVARDLLLAGERFDARRAEEVGLVSRVVPAGSLEGAARALAATIAGHPPDAIRRIKEELAAATEGAFEAALRDEARHELACFEGPEVRARLQAFADRKRAGSP